MAVIRLGIVKAEHGEQEEPCGDAEGCCERGDAKRQQQRIHGGLHKHRADNAQHSPTAAHQPGAVKGCCQGDAGRDGTIAIESAHLLITGSAQHQYAQQSYGRRQCCPQKSPTIGNQQPHQKEDARHPRVYQKYLSDAAQPDTRQLARVQREAPEARVEHLQHGRGECCGRHSGQHARREEKHPRAKHKREGE